MNDLDSVSSLEEAVQYKSYVDEVGDWSSRKISLFGVVRSVVGQLKPGQDMTKVSLPSAFLEPYSILELAASRLGGYFPMLTETKGVDPLHRMLAVVRWYLASYTELAFEKKPYNSTLGETHKCRIPTSNGSVQYIAEQVSHHPPVTAMAMVHPEEGLDVNGNVSFSVKFHGNSVSVNTVGGLRLHLKNNESDTEVYTISKSLPDVLINNILFGTRFIGWSGEVEFVCEKTGYRVEMKFSSKKKKKSVAGEFFLGGDQIGQFNGMWAEEPIYLAHKTLGNILVVDATKSKKSAIILPNASELDETSTVKIWHEVSENIVKGDLSAADSIKKKVEAAARAKRNQYNSEKEFPRKYFEYSEELEFWQLKQEHSPAVTSHHHHHKTHHHEKHHHDKHHHDKHHDKHKHKKDKKKKIQLETTESSEGATVSVNN
jgi:hypothetical protein